MTDNPFKSPVDSIVAESSQLGVFRNALKLPAIILISLSTLWLMAHSVWMSVQFERLFVLNQDANQEEASVLSIVWLCVGVILTIAVIIGSINMLRLKNRRSVMLALYISLIPFCGSPCIVLGIPFGIWALVLMHKPAVKSLFDN